MKKKNSGIALVLVIIVFAVLSILGATLLEVSLYENKHAIRDTKKIKAYYNAKSGVEAVAAWMEKNSSNAADIIGKSSQDKVTLDSGTEGSFKVQVTRDAINTKKIIIKGTGEVGGVTNTASMEMLETSISSPGEIFGQAIYSGENITLKGSSEVVGDVRSGEKIISQGGKDHITGDELQDSPMDTPLAQFPADPTLSTNEYTININTTISYKSTPYVYDNFSVSGGRTILTFDTSGGDIVLVANTIDFETGSKGGIVVTGPGNVTIYANKVANFNSTINKNGLPKQMFLILSESAELQIASNDIQKMFVYAPKSKVNISGTPDIFGSIVANEINVTGNMNVTYTVGDSEGLPIDSISGTKYSKVKWCN